MLDKKETIDSIRKNSLNLFKKELEDCNDKEKFKAVSKTIMEMILPKWKETNHKFEDKRKAYYFSAEYLMGRALSNNLINMGYKEDLEKILEELNINYNEIEEAESDAGLGNGGLGRLAACFLDSAATLDYPLTGYGIRYEYGIFIQSFEDGFQVEEADNWLEYGDPWSIKRKSDEVRVSFADGDVLAVPYDTPIVGYGGNTINTLRLWESKAVNPFDFQEFNRQNYMGSVKEKNEAETISKVLYPNDSTEAGKILRLRQQYFFVSASLQDLVRKHLNKYQDMSNFHELHAIQLNDTHPAVAIPELMRILTKTQGMDWKAAWNIVENTFAYTNHTILKEALEQWPINFYKALLPDVYEMIEKINHDLLEELKEKGIKENKLNEYSIIENNQIRMAYLAIYGSYSTNGVARLHSDILMGRELKNWYEIYPERFNNKTNGITQRRWLLQSNPELSSFITNLLGDDSWITDLKKLKSLEKFKDDEETLMKFLEIKQIKKDQLTEYIMETEGIEIDPHSIFDIQIKRLHEYKRQLLNALHILDLYFRVKEDPTLDIPNRTFIFGAKAAPGYTRAKGIIKFINEIKDLVNNDPDINDRIKVVFTTNYDVSYGEKLFPAADLSEQISTAGKEASGTGNMKFMLNGAPTIGTLDGANIEIVEEAGLENNFIFGLTVEDIKELESNYDPKHYYRNTKGLKRVVDTLIDGTFSDSGTGIFREIYDSLINGVNWESADVYYVLKDFDAYRQAQELVSYAYKDKLSWAKKCWMNIANAGKFSSDRTIEDYARDIWKIEKEV